MASTCSAGILSRYQYAETINQAPYKSIVSGWHTELSLWPGRTATALCAVWLWSREGRTVGRKVSWEDLELCP